jgi:hypothetical protein
VNVLQLGHALRFGGELPAATHSSESSSRDLDGPSSSLSEVFAVAGEPCAAVAGAPL